jgi:hypothetical protein
VTPTKVGIREFRAGLTDYIDGDSPVAVTRHGHTVGFFIPTKGDLTADVAALRSAKAQLDALIEVDAATVDEIASDFKEARRRAAR